MASESCCTICLCHVECCFLRAGVGTRREHELDHGPPRTSHGQPVGPQVCGVSRTDTSSEADSSGASCCAERAYSRGNMEGTQARPRASTRGSFVAIRFPWLAGLSCPRRPARTRASLLRT